MLLRTQMYILTFNLHRAHEDASSRAHVLPILYIRMMQIHIIVICILPPRVEMYKVFEPYFGISFGSFKVRVIVRITTIHASRDGSLHAAEGIRKKQRCMHVPRAFMQ